MSEYEPTVAEIEQAISDAMCAGEIPVVVSLLHLLAVKAPERAQLFLDGVEMIRRLDQTHGGDR